MGLFDAQVGRKPNNYPWTQEIIDALWTSHWTPNEFNFRSDYGQFQTELTDQERQIIVRTLSAIGQIEIAVKRFWGDLGKNFPHPAMSDMGFVMANNEVIHNLAYEKLLDVLNLQHVFDETLKEPVIAGRVEYLRKYLDRVYQDDRKQYVYALILFTLFIENTSLFGQFYVILHFNRYRNVLKDTSQQVQYTRLEEECFVDGTEVLTPVGWKKISDMNVGDQVFHYLEDGRLELTKVLNTTSKPYAGEMVEFSRKGNRCVVTPNHNMVVYTPAGGSPRLVKAKDVKLHKKCIFPKRTNNLDGSVNSLTVLERIWLAVQADGSKLKWTRRNGEVVLRGDNGGYNYGVALYKDRKITRFRDLLEQTDLKWAESESSNGGRYFRINLPMDKDFKSLNWVDLKDKSYGWCRDFVDEVGHWDGWKSDAGETLGYCSSDKFCVDMFQAVAMAAGYHTCVIHKVDNRSETYSDTWRVLLSEGNPLPISHGMTKKSVYYEGDVSCITVPSGMIPTRYMDATFIAGNCHTRVGVMLINTLRQEYPEMFDAELEARVTEEVQNAVAYEGRVIDWMLGDYQDRNLSADVVKAYTTKRLDDAMKQVGFSGVSMPDNLKALLPRTTWMEEELKGVTLTDFFQQRPVEYAKKHRAFDAEELF